MTLADIQNKYTSELQRLQVWFAASPKILTLGADSNSDPAEYDVD